MSNFKFFLDQYQSAEVNFLQSKILMMEQFSTSEKYMDVYYSVLSEIGDEVKAFEYVASQFKLLFGYYKFKNFNEFKKHLPKATHLDKASQQYLIYWFKEKGFSSWESFKSLVLHYYPEITEVRLKRFYDCKTIELDVLQKIEYVKQIIG